MPGVFDLEYFQRALIAASLVGVLCPVIGVFLVLRRLSLIGDGLGHISFAGVTFGWVVDVYPLLTAAIFAVGGAAALEALRARRREYADLALAILFYTGIALGILFISLADTFGTSVYSFLFGSIITVSRQDVATVAGLTAVVLAAVTVLYRPLVAVTFDEDLARTAGLPVRWLNLALAVVAALTVVVGIRVVGVLLVAALMAVPVAGALQVARSLRSTLAVAVLFGEVSGVGGLVASYYLDLAPGGTIVIVAVLLFLGAILFSRGYRSAALILRLRQAPVSPAGRDREE
jgi:zinc transport system permease protein